jgi:hypothetical protein
MDRPYIIPVKKLFAISQQFLRAHPLKYEPGSPIMRFKGRPTTIGIPAMDSSFFHHN